MKALYTIVGMKHRGSDVEAYVRGLPTGTAMELRRESTNSFDENAVQVWVNEKHIGYVKRQEAVELAQQLDSKPEAGARAAGRLVIIDRWPHVELDE